MRLLSILCIVRFFRIVLTIGWVAVAVAAAGCLEGPGSEGASGGPRIAAKWDPRACGEPHRVALELEDEEGRRISSSAPCASGGLTLEAPHLGVYVGRIYAWTAGRPIRSVIPVQIDVDEATERWTVATPE
jgi:hypothetical protein